MDKLLLFPFIAGFFLTLFLMPIWIRKARQIGLVWQDMNKRSNDKVAGSGGLIAVSGFIFSSLIFVSYRVFYLDDFSNLIEIFAIILVVVFLTMIGLIDDLFGWQRGGLSRRSRLLLVLFSALPLIVINAGKSAIYLPFIGVTDAGLFYPLLLIPLGIVGATTTYNFLAGFNGLEAGQGVILLSGMAFVAYYTGNPWLSVISICMVASLIAFLFFNISPAKVFPGDSLTYAIGGLIAVIAIIGNFEQISLFFFIPYILEVILKSRGKLIKHSFGKPLEDGSLDLKYDKLYGLTHVSIYLMKKSGIKPTEEKVVYSIWLFQIIFMIIGIIIFRDGIFI